MPYINNERTPRVNATDIEILERVMEAFELETGRRLHVQKLGTRIGDQEIDAVVQFGGVEYNVQIKRWVQQANLGALIHQVQQLPGNKLLIADYVNKNLAKRLKEAGVQFLDTAGNAYVNQEDLYLNIRGNDPLVTLTVKDRQHLTTTVPIGKNRDIRPEQHRVTGRAFTPTGLQVVYEITRDPELIDRPYREIAERADVALGTVGWVINDLKGRGIVVNRRGHKHIANMKTLIQAWAEAYPLKLRLKCFVGGFIADDPLWWKEFNIKNYGGQWGGETAAAILTGYLKPQVTTLYVRADYTQAEIAKIIQAARLRRANRETDANVEILHPFWPQNEPDITVHPLVVYADLIATGGAQKPGNRNNDL